MLSINVSVGNSKINSVEKVAISGDLTWDLLCSTLMPF